jgi:hypothetical protein
MTKKISILGILFTLFFYSQCERLLAQDPLGQSNIDGLKGLREVAVVIRFNYKGDITLNQIVDAVLVVLRSKIPNLKVTKVEESAAWLRIEFFGDPIAAHVEVNIHRWARLNVNQQEVFANVWQDSRLISGDLSRKFIVDTLDEIVTHFAADFYRANQK